MSIKKIKERKATKKKVAEDRMNMAMSDVVKKSHPKVEEKFTGSPDNPRKELSRKNSFAKHSAKTGKKKCK